MKLMKLREKIARFEYNLHPDFDEDGVLTWQEAVESNAYEIKVSYKEANSILSLINSPDSPYIKKSEVNKRIEGIENPYKDNDVTFYHQFEQGFNLALQKVKEVIGK